MILVDSSVWISSFRNHSTPATTKLDLAVDEELILLGDLILLELLQGARNDAHAEQIREYLQDYEVIQLLDGELAEQAASNYRKLRGLGITVRKTPDLIIGTFCIENDYALLHDDRDFLPMERYLGLQVI